ncbi:MAG: flagellar motor protein MotB [Alphaproteobacteria bacterium]
MSDAVIIKKVKKGGHDAHHGGAWKVAYADFVTAMMAFFLLMWLLNATSEEQRKGIADYFSPIKGIMTSPSGGAGMMGGQTSATRGSMNSAFSPPSASVSLSPPSADEDGDAEGGKPAEDKLAEERGKLTTKELDKLLSEREQERLNEAEAQIKQAIQDMPEMRKVIDNLIVEQTPEGLRIQIVDQERLSMFPLGSAQMYDHTRKLLAVVSEIIGRLPNQIAITGHTDATPYARGSSYTNWELSSDRAQASRRALTEGGLAPRRIAQVIGRADQELLLPADPTSPRNRRISIVILRERPLAGPDKATQPG